MLYQVHPSFHVYSMFLSMSYTPPFRCHPPTDWALWGEHKGHWPKCISWHVSVQTFPFSRIHAIWNTALVWALWQLLQHPSEVAGALNYRASRFCWTSATREGNTLILPKSQLQVWETLLSHPLSGSGAHHSDCNYLPESTDSLYLWRNQGGY